LAGIGGQVIETSFEVCHDIPAPRPSDRVDRHEPAKFPGCPCVCRLLYGRDELRCERGGLPVEPGVGEQLGAQPDAAILFNELSGTPAGICCARRGWHPALADG
jgi:hypothetical protein